MSVQAVSGVVVRLADVAAAAGVSLSTASRALSGDSRVHPNTRKRVERMAKRLDYRPDPIARSLATARTFTVGLLVHDIEDPFTAALAAGLDKTLVQAGYVFLLVSMGRTAARRKQALELVTFRRVDGIIATVHSDDDVPQTDLPLVAVGRPASLRVPYVGVDNVEGGRIAARHLLAGGATRPGILLSRRELLPVADRVTGFMEVMDAAGVPVKIVEVADFTYTPAYNGARKLLKLDVDGLFAISDLMGAAVRGAAQQAGVRVPDDLSIVGYDDAPLAAWPNVDLSSVGQYTDQLCQAISDMLVARVADPERDMPSVVLRPHLVKRSSSRDEETTSGSR